jgi:hypothetical protein
MHVMYVWRETTVIVASAPEKKLGTVNHTGDATDRYRRITKILRTVVHRVTRRAPQRSTSLPPGSAEMTPGRLWAAGMSPTTTGDAPSFKAYRAGRKWSIPEVRWWVAPAATAIHAAQGLASEAVSSLLLSTRT